MTAPDPSCCNFFRGGWNERFREVGHQALSAFLAAHPELASTPSPGGVERPDREFGI